MAQGPQGGADERAGGCSWLGSEGLAGGRLQRWFSIGITRSYIATKRTVLLEALQGEAAAIVSGTHPELLERLAVLERMRERRLRDARLYRDLRTAEVEGLFKFENKAAVDCFEASAQAIGSPSRPLPPLLCS